jgi:hypothetical protein
MPVAVRIRIALLLVYLAVPIDLIRNGGYSPWLPPNTAPTSGSKAAGSGTIRTGRPLPSADGFDIWPTSLPDFPAFTLRSARPAEEGGEGMRWGPACSGLFVLLGPSPITLGRPVRVRPSGAGTGIYKAGEAGWPPELGYQRWGARSLAADLAYRSFGENLSDFAGSARVRNRMTARTTTQTRKATMLTRSHSLAQGVGRFAWTRGASIVERANRPHRGQSRDHVLSDRLGRNVRVQESHVSPTLPSQPRHRAAAPCSLTKGSAVGTAAITADSVGAGASWAGSSTALPKRSEAPLNTSFPPPADREVAGQGTRSSGPDSRHLLPAPPSLQDHPKTGRGRGGTLWAGRTSCIAQRA